MFKKGCDEVVCLHLPKIGMDALFAKENDRAKKLFLFLLALRSGESVCWA